jgi:DNA-binding MarR family transcriptional regulator
VSNHADTDGAADTPATPTAPLTLYLVKRLERVIRALLDDALRPLGLTTVQYTALSVLQNRGALSSAQLARRSFLRPQTMHEMVLALEKRGLITRTPQEDNKRILLATLSQAGHTLLHDCAPAVLELEHALLDDLGPAHSATFRDGLHQGITTFARISESRRTTTEPHD